jgi:hypothetical protein
MRHTSGPWMVQPIKGSFQVPFHILSEDGKPVAYCEGQQLRPDRTSVGEARANASLIAAAPDLLAALIRMRDEFNSYADCPSKCDAVSMAFQAVEKAGGE